MAVDAAGNVYVADAGNNAIRKVTAGGVVTMFAGSGMPTLATPQGGSDGTGAAARFENPLGVAVDGAGNVYVADTGNATIRKVTPAGVVTTLAGSAGLPGSDDGTGDAARFAQPSGVAVDGAGNVYVADSGNATIRKVTPAGVVTTLAGTAQMVGSDDGTGADARFENPLGVAVDGAGNVYVADNDNYTVRKVTAAGVVTTLAGSAGMPGSDDGTGDAARFDSPAGVAVDGAGNVYVAEWGNATIRKVTAAGVVTTLAGFAAIRGSADGTGDAAQFNNVRSVALDGAGNLVVADTGNNTIRKVTAAGVVTTLAGAAVLKGSDDGTGAAARFDQPRGVVFNAGDLFVTDWRNGTIRKVTAAGVVTTFAGSAGFVESKDGTGAAAHFFNPEAMAVDGAGNIYVGDTGGSKGIRKVTLAGVVTTLAAMSGMSRGGNGTSAPASFLLPLGVAVDGAGSVYVSEYMTHSLRKLTPTGLLTTVSAAFTGPRGLASDNAGNVYVADTNNHTIRKVTAVGSVTTLAGASEMPGRLDGTGPTASFNSPYGVAVDGAGNVFVADTGNRAIRKVTATGVVTTIGDTQGYGIVLGSKPGFSRPVALTVAGDSLAVVDGNAVLMLRHGAQ